MRGYVATAGQEAAAVPNELKRFEATLKTLQDQFLGFMERAKMLATLMPEQKQPLADELAELAEARQGYDADRAVLLGKLADFRDRYAAALPDTNEAQHTARHAFEPLADQTKGLVKQVDLLYKLAARCGTLAQELAAIAKAGEGYDRRLATKRLKQLDEERKQAVEQLKAAAYFHRQIVWLQDRFPTAEMQAVPGLCRVVTRTEIKAADWNLTPGRYVGVAQPEVDEDFDFEQTLRDIHVELMDLNREAVELAAKIAQNFEELV